MYLSKKQSKEGFNMLPDASKTMKRLFNKSVNDCRRTIRIQAISRALLISTQNDDLKTRNPMMIEYKRCGKRFIRLVSKRFCMIKFERFFVCLNSNILYVLNILPFHRNDLNTYEFHFRP